MTEETLAKIAEVRDLHSQILCAPRKTLEQCKRIGELLTDIRREVGHGGWEEWLRANVGFGIRTARRYMALFDNRELLDEHGAEDVTTAYKAIVAANEPEEKREKAKGKTEATTFYLAHINGLKQWIHQRTQAEPIDAWPEEVRKRLKAELQPIVAFASAL